MSKTKYTKTYFLKKFRAIPSKRWCIGAAENGFGQRCVIGHCGVLDYGGTPEIEALAKLLRRGLKNAGEENIKRLEVLDPVEVCFEVNDNLPVRDSLVNLSPRARILKVLNAA